MRLPTTLLPLLGLVSLAAAGCDAEPATETATLPAGTPSVAEVALTPRSDALAEGLAVRCAATLIADQATYETLSADLDAIAAVRGARPGDHFVEVATPAPLILDLPAERDAALLAGDDPAFELLNARLGGVVFGNERVREVLGDAVVTLSFDGVFQPELLEALYAEALGVETGVSHDGLAGDGDSIAYDLSTSPRRYIVTVGEGDCPSGCQFHTPSYWTVDDAGVAVEVEAFAEGGSWCAHPGAW